MMKNLTLRIAAATLAASITAPSVAGAGDVILKLVKVNSARVQYDWLQRRAKPAPTSDLSVTERKRLAARVSGNGRGSYICSPAGSGMRSRCFAR